MKGKKLLCVLLCISMISCMQLTACSACANQNEIAETESEKPEVVEPVERTPENYAFTWDPYKFNDDLETRYGELARDDYHYVVDAIINQEENCYCTAAFANDLMSILEVMFPPAVDFFTYTQDEEGYLHFTYNKTIEEQNEAIDKFRNEIKTIVKGYLYSGDTDAMLAVELYKRYAAMDNQTTEAKIYAHLCIQCGIPAGIEKQDNHEVVYIFLDESKYYVDIINSDEGENMAYFGITQSDDLRFAELQKIVSSAVIDRSGKELYIVGYDDAMNQIRVKVE